MNEKRPANGALHKSDGQAALTEIVSAANPNGTESLAKAAS